jgi:23S rRNA (uracil1939-C5)-methyltransferase
MNEGFAPGRRVELNTERLAPEGSAVARVGESSLVVFVPYGAPQEKIEAEIIENKSTFARAKLLRVIEPSPDRIEPLCVLHFAPGRTGAACGGCDWQHLSYEAQLKHKRGVVADCLSRIAKIRDADIRPTLASPSPWGYRNKVQIPFGVGANGKPIAGFYATQSRQIIDQQACPVQPDLSVRIELFVKAAAERFGWAIYDADKQTGWLRHLYIRTNSAGRALAALVTRTEDFPQRDRFIEELRAAFPEIIGFFQNIQTLKTAVVLGPHWIRLWGVDTLQEKIGPFTFLVSPASFLQVNTKAAELLYGEAAAALEFGGRSFDLTLDLYCGVGASTLWAARGAKRVLGIEENKEAIRDAWRNVRGNNVSNVSFQAGKVESILPRLRRDLPESVAALVDPPRAGLSTPALRFLTSREIRRIVYISCDPATFARDAGYLLRSGFKIGPVQPVDLFPQTSHVELVARFDR